MNRIEKIKEVVLTEKENATKELYDAALNADTKSVAVIATDIKMLEKLLANFINEEPEKKSNNKNNKQTNSEEQKTSAMESETSSYPITANFTNKRPLSIEMDGKTELTNSFRSLTEVACRMAYDKNRSRFASLCSNPNVNGDRHQYFSTTSQGMDDPVMIGSGKSAIYVDTAKLAINNLYFLKKALSELDYNLDEIKVEVDPNYTRKSREKK